MLVWDMSHLEFDTVWTFPTVPILKDIWQKIRCECSGTQFIMKKRSFILLCVLLSTALCWLSACGLTVNQVKPQQTLTVNQQFQGQLTPIPTIPAYRCGAWASNNAPGAYGSLIIYARLTKGSASGFAGVMARAVVHFKSRDVPSDGQPISDSGGYVAFDLFLAGRQPARVPATVDVTFDTQGSPTTCTAFFTPQ
jgi:hypothetical protein